MGKKPRIMENIEKEGVCELGSQYFCHFGIDGSWKLQRQKI
jgi:hypothetical protein